MKVLPLSIQDHSGTHDLLGYHEGPYRVVFLAQHSTAQRVATLDGIWEQTTVHSSSCKEQVGCLLRQLKNNILEQNGEQLKFIV